MTAAKVVLFLVDLSLALHAIFKFFLGIVCHARVYVRKQIRFYETVENSSDPVKLSKAVNANRKIFKIYIQFAYRSLLAFAAASFVCFKILVAHFIKFYLYTKLSLLRKLYSNTKYDAGQLYLAGNNLKKLIPKNKSLPQNVTIILPCLRSLNDSPVFCTKLEIYLLFLYIIEIKNITLFLPFANDPKLIYETIRRAEKYDNVSFIFSLKEASDDMLDALNSSRRQQPRAVEPCDVTKRINGVHADMILVSGGFPCLYGFVPWHTKLSEIFFLPHIDCIMLDDIVGAFHSNLSIEQRFGK